MYRLIAFDIDGTLVNSKKVITPKTQKALEALKSNGTEIVISSGRPYNGVLRVADQAKRELVTYGSCFNGGLIKKIATGETLYAASLETEGIHEITKLALDADLDIIGHSEDTIMVARPPKTDYIVLESKLNDMPIEVVDFLAPDIKVPKLIVTASSDALAEFRSSLPGIFDDHFNIVKSADFFLEFNPNYVSKGEGLKNLAAHMNISQKEVMAFGDHGNDLSMIEWAGCGVAMGNAIPELKEAAQFVTLSNDEEGIAHALEELVLRQI